MSRKLFGMSKKDGEKSMAELIADAKKAMEEKMRLNDSVRQKQAQPPPLQLSPQWNDDSPVNPAAFSSATYPNIQNVKGNLKQDDNPASVLASFEGYLKDLYETKTRKALLPVTALAVVKGLKNGIANEIVKLLVNRMERETEPDKRLLLFELVDSIVWHSLHEKGKVEASMIPALLSALPQFVAAAAAHETPVPPDSIQSKNQQKYVKILTKWNEDYVFPERVLGQCIDKVLGFQRSDDEGEYRMIEVMGGLINDQHGSNDGMQFGEDILNLKGLSIEEDNCESKTHHEIGDLHVLEDHKKLTTLQLSSPPLNSPLPISLPPSPLPPPSLLKSALASTDLPPPHLLPPCLPPPSTNVPPPSIDFPPSPLPLSQSLLTSPPPPPPPPPSAHLQLHPFPLIQSVLTPDSITPPPPPPSAHLQSHPFPLNQSILTLDSSTTTPPPPPPSSHLQPHPFPLKPSPLTDFPQPPLPLSWPKLIPPHPPPPPPTNLPRPPLQLRPPPLTPPPFPPPPSTNLSPPSLTLSRSLLTPLPPPTHLLPPLSSPPITPQLPPPPSPEISPPPLPLDPPPVTPPPPPSSPPPVTPPPPPSSDLPSPVPLSQPPPPPIDLPPPLPLSPPPQIPPPPNSPPPF